MKNLGTKAVKVEFSEPIEKAVVGNFTIDGKPFYGSVTQGSRELILTPYDSTTLSVGDHTLTVAGVEDYFGLKALSSEHKFTVVEDKVAPTVTNVDATLERAVVTFSEEVDPSTVQASNVYWKQGSTKRYANSYKKLASDKYEFSFTTNPLPAFETTLFVEGVKDYSGNTISETEVKVTAKVDQTRPEVTEVKADSADAKNITVKFSKVVNAADKKYFTVLDANGNVQPILEVVPADGSGQVFTVKLYNNLKQGQNTIKISGVKDRTALENTMLDYETVIGVKDSTPPTVSASSANNSSRSVVITFSEQMDLASIADPSNYLVAWSADGSGTGTLRTLPAGTQVTPVQNGRAVLITFPEFLGNTKITFPEAAASIAGTVKSVQVMGVKDAAGNILSGYSHLEPLTVAPAQLKAYGGGVTKNAVFVDKTTVKVKFNQAIGTANASDFTTTLGVPVQTATADGTDVVTLKFASSVGTNIADNTISVKANNNMRTVNGNTVVPAGASFTIEDEVKPEVQLAPNVTTLANTGNTIHLPFSEVLTDDANKIALFENDLIVTNLATGKAVTLDRIVTTRGAGNKTIDIAITPAAGEVGEYSVKVKSGAQYIQDMNENTAVESATYETLRGAVDGASPLLTAAALTADAVTIGSFGDLADELTLTFNEAVKLNLTDNTATAGAYDMTAAELAAITGLTVADGAFTAKVVDNNKVVVTVTTAITNKIVANDTISVNGTATNKVLDIAGNSLAATTGVKLVDRVAPLAATEDGSADKEGTTQTADFNIVVNAETGAKVTATVGGVNVLKSVADVTAASGTATLPIDFAKLADGSNAIVITVTDASGNASTALTVNVTK